MKHIIVTTPKSEIETSAQEAEECIKNGEGYYFRKLSKQPQDIEIGKSKVYYVEDGYIRGFGIISGITHGTQKCQTTGREWGNEKNCFVIIPACTWKWIKPIQMNGFQGWRYFEDSGVEIIGNWQDRKPNIEG